VANRLAALQRRLDAIERTLADPQVTSAETDPLWSDAKKLDYYRASTHMLWLNVSERCRRAAHAEGLREAERRHP